jgi:hypothetical protein
MKTKLLTVAASWAVVFGGTAGLGLALGQDASANLSPAAQPVSVPQAKETTERGTNAPVSFHLKPTPIAPAGAGGSAEIKGNSLEVHLSQIGPGKYDVRAVGQSDGASRLLGTITIVDPTVSPSRQATDNKKEASANPESVIVETDASISLPGGLARPGLAEVQVLGAGGNVVLDSLAK